MIAKEIINRLDKLEYHYHQLTRRQVELDIRLKQMEGRLISVKDRMEKK